MSLSTDPVSRLALILPRARLQEWHRELAARLSRSYRVDISLDDRAPPYAWSVRLWLALEQRISGRCALVNPVPADANWLVANPTKVDADVLVINLSERPWYHAGALELRYGGHLDSRALLSRLLALASPRLSVEQAGQTGALASSYLAIEAKLSLSRACQAAYMRAIALIARALQSDRSAVDDRTDAAAVPAHDGLALSGFILRVIATRAVWLALKPFARFDHWHVALRMASGTFKVLHDDGQRFYADPFLQRWGDRTFLFVEEFSYASGRGVIAAAEVYGDQVPVRPVHVLTRPYHLSYPFVFEHEGAHYMLPETGGNQSLELYRAVDFPWTWEAVGVLMDGAVYSDATLLRHEGLWWLFVTISPPGGSTQDELSIFHSETLQGRFVPHPANPVKSDCRSSRPAGRIVRKGDRLFRPAQDCERTYGAGLIWLEIMELTPGRFRECEVARWDGEAELGMGGLHSFDQLGPLQAIDFKHTIGRGPLRRPLREVAMRDPDAFDLLAPAPGDPCIQDRVAADRLNPLATGTAESSALRPTHYHQ